MTTIDLTIPIPPAGNRLRRVDWRNRPAHVAWQHECDLQLLVHRDLVVHRVMVTERKPHVLFPVIRGPYAVTVTVDRTCRLDPDSTLKALLDYLVRVELVTDDSPKYLQEIHIYRGDVGAGKLRIVVQSMET